MDRFEAMHYFVTAVDTGSFSAAGRKLGVPVATLSRKVNDLEQHLKTRLFNRTTRLLALTDSGAAYLSHCKAILDRVADAEVEAGGEYLTPKGQLTMTAPMVFGKLHVLPVVNEFLKNYPDININLLLSDQAMNLVEDHIDLAVRSGNLTDMSLKTTKVGQVRRIVIASPEYLAAHGTPKTLDDLQHHRCVTFNGMRSPLAWSFMRPSGEVLTPTPPLCRLNVNTAEAAIEGAVEGIGMTQVLSYQAANALQAGKLKIVLEDWEPQPIAMNLIHAGQGQLPLKMRRFLEFAVPRFRKLMAFQPTTAF